MREIEQIPYPSEREKAASIERILDAGMPERQSMFAKLDEIFQTIGFRGLFFGVGGCMLAGLVFTVCIYMIIFQLAVWNSSVLPVFLLMVSPFLYAFLYLLTVSKEIMTGMYELKMTCRYNLRQLAVLRMLIFGAAAVIVTCFGNIWLQYRMYLQHIPIMEFSDLKLLSIAFSALFLYASAQMAAEIRMKSIRAGFLVPVGWCLLSVLLLAFGKTALHILAFIPTAVLVLTTVLAGYLYYCCLKQYYYCQKEEIIGSSL